MKYIKHSLAVIALALISSDTLANEEYVTGCSYEVTGDRTTYKYRTINETAAAFISTTDISPKACVEKAAAAVKQTYPAQFLSGGHFQTTHFRNKVVTIKIIHKDNVDFPRQQLDLSIVQDSCLSLKNGFEFVNSWVDDDYNQAKVANVDCNATKS